MFNIARKLSRAGILGINGRNCEYQLFYNPRRYYPLVDDKLRTKQLAQDAGIAVPDLYGVIEIQHQIAELPEFLKKYTDFVLKPAHGTGGEGIEVVIGRTKDLYQRANGRFITNEELKHHVSNILNGLFSLGGQDDKAIIEYRVKFDPVFEYISYQGVPDIRIIVFLGIPVMAMIRLPTHMSDGKANLHKGAIGVGIDLATGETQQGVWGNEIVNEHPDTRYPLTGLLIPNWNKLLEIAARCYELTGLGYMGVDFVLDKTKGPLVLEMNARPGLNIQIANRVGLLPRLKYVQANASSLGTIQDRINISRRVIPNIH